MCPPFCSSILRPVPGARPPQPTHLSPNTVRVRKGREKGKGGHACRHAGMQARHVIWLTGWMRGSTRLHSTTLYSIPLSGQPSQGLYVLYMWLCLETHWHATRAALAIRGGGGFSRMRPPPSLQKYLGSACGGWAGRINCCGRCHRRGIVKYRIAAN